MSSLPIEWIRRVVTESLAGLAGARVFHTLASEENKIAMGWIGAILGLSTAIGLNIITDTKIKKKSYAEGESNKDKIPSSAINYRIDHAERASSRKDPINSIQSPKF